LGGFGLQLKNVLSYSAQTLRSGRYYGSAFFALDGFMKGCIGTTWKTRKVYDYLVFLRSISFWLCTRLPKVVKFSC